MTMRLLIAGSRNIQLNNKDIDIAAEYYLGTIPSPDVVICGMAGGVDWAGKTWAESRAITVWEMPYVKSLGKGGGPFRNRSMAQIADKALIWWDGKSPGTRNMLKHLEDFGVSHHIILRESQ